MKKLLFVISQLYKGGAETSLVNLLNKLDYSKYAVDLLILNQVPVKDAVSLIDRVNRNVRVCNAYEEAQHHGVCGRLKNKILYTADQRNKFYASALEFVRNKEYDWAFFVGEWCSPEFVAMEVEAKKKAAWIHSDISKASYFDEKHYFSFLDKYDYFIFVSQHSLESSLEKYPFLRDKAVTIYNINDVDTIKKQSAEEVTDFPETKLPVLLTCANFRDEKNHLRQVRVLAELKKRGVDVTWVNIGSTANTPLVDRVRQDCKKYGVEDRFLILGPRSNPYKYMKMADAVTVLSDHESWSMVITEAKILGKPVISTRTSGGLEQIVDKETGLLTDFNEKSIADAIELFVKDVSVKQTIENNIKNFDNTGEILAAFDALINRNEEFKNDILYVVDDINYLGGAHSATKKQIRVLLDQNKSVTIFSRFSPDINTRKELNGVRFLVLQDTDIHELYRQRLSFCLCSKKYSSKEKLQKFFLTCKGYRKKLDYDKDILPFTTKLFSQFQIVCVMSEASAFRKFVGDSAAQKKIQWIHTDYVAWSNYNEWTRSITKDDGEIYKSFDKIIVLTEGIGDRMAGVYPHLASKLEVSRNLMPVEEIKQKSKPISIKNEKPLHFITVGRLGNEKEYPRLIRILKRLKEDGYRFTWTIVGGGGEFEHIRHLIQSSDLEKEIHMTGNLDNPYRKMAVADVFALLSRYEGLPNTIYESLILGVPVLATNVGGIADQIKDGETGWLVENDEDSILKKISYLLMNQDEVRKAKERLEAYSYDNKEILDTINDIFAIDK